VVDGVPRSRAPRAQGGARGAAARAVERTLAARSSAEGLLGREGAAFDERDRRLLAELVYGVLRWHLRLEHVIALAAGRAVDAIDADLRPVLEVAVFQLLFLDRVPAHAAVAEAVDEARRRRGPGAAGFVNAVLRRVAATPSPDAWPVEERDPARDLALRWSHPEALVRRWLGRFGREATERALASDNGPRPVHLLAFADRGGPAALVAALAAEGIAATAATLSPLGVVVESGAPFASAAFARGDAYAQDLASQAAALVPDPAAEERVLDAAAAPGGKGIAILARRPSARVVFADVAPARVARLAANLRRLGRRAPVVVADAAAPPWRQRFDRVVLDAPCSGTGTLRRHPDLRWRFRPDELDRLAAGALHLLRALAGHVAPGGALVHVTCSVEAEENEGVAARFLAAESDFGPDPLEALPSALAGGRIAPGRWRVLPGEGHDGFSVAVFRRAR
jgi:16S rRNA (cytosine967-C5)-methyltransferase